jgi:hypothetical protein
VGGAPKQSEARYGVKIPPRPSENISTSPPARLEQNAESKIFFSFYLPAEASAQAGKKKLVARAKKRIVKKILLEA